MADFHPLDVVLLRGKRRGQIARLHQWSNDWFMFDEGYLTSPTNFRFTRETLEEIQKVGTGMMFQMFEAVCHPDPEFHDYPYIFKRIRHVRN